MNFKFLKLIKTKEGYEYCQRKGKDSVAFLLFDGSTGKVLLRNEYKPPIDSWLLGAFGGSLDKNKSLVYTVIDEAVEEAGFKVNEEDVHYVGKYFVSSQMNQFCFLYIVDVTNAATVEKQFEDNAEAISDTHWASPHINNLQCWKANIILDKIRKIFLHG